MNLICALVGHRRYDDPPWYWHSHERCARCRKLVPFDAVGRRGWRVPPGHWELRR